MKTSFKRAAAWLLTVLMILSCVPAMATESVTEVGAGFSLDIPTTYADDTGYTVTFDKNSSSISSSNWTVGNITTDEDGEFVFPSPSVMSYTSGRTTYYFAGWSTSSSGTGTYFTDDEGNVTENTTFYAIWSTNSYPLYCYALVPNVTTEEADKGTVPDNYWYGVGTGTISGVNAPSSYKTGNEDYGTFGDLALPTTYPDITFNGKTYKYVSANDSHYLNGEDGYYTIQWIRVVKNADGINAGINKYFTAKNGNTFHLDGLILLSEANKLTVTFAVKYPESNAFSALESYAQRVAKNTNESELQKPTADDLPDQTIDGVVYTFDGWYLDQNFEKKATFTENLTTNRTYYGHYVRKTADYTVEYYLEDGTTYTLKERVTLTDNINAVVSADEKSFEGYTLDKSIAGTNATDTVAADGSTVLKLFYKRDRGNLTLTKNVEDTSNTYVETGFTINVKPASAGGVSDAEWTAWVSSQNKATNDDGSISVTLTPDATNKTAITTLSNLPTGTYTVTEVEHPAYTTTIDKSSATVQKGGTDTVTVTNTRKMTTVSVTKVWQDNEDATGVRPESLDVTLQKVVTNKDVDVSGDEGDSDSAETTTTTSTVDVSSVTLTSSGNWATSWQVPEYDVDGEKITYTVTEDVPVGYVSSLEETESVFILTNRLNTQTVQVTKYIAGNMGDQSKQFTFTVTATGTNNDTVPISYTADNQTVTLEDPYTVNLAHNQSSAVLTIPYGAKVTISETNTDSSYKQQWSTDNQTWSTLTADTDYEISNLTSDQHVYCKNTKDVVPDTGVVLDSLPYIVILAIVLVGVVLMVRKRRREDD